VIMPDQERHFGDLLFFDESLHGFETPDHSPWPGRRTHPTNRRIALARSPSVIWSSAWMAGRRGRTFCTAWKSVSGSGTWWRPGGVSRLRSTCLIAALSRSCWRPAIRARALPGILGCGNHRVPPGLNRFPSVQCFADGAGPLPFCNSSGQRVSRLTPSRIWGSAAILGNRCIVAFPRSVSPADRLGSYWERG
jgi:hypothetical protein